MYPTEGEGVEMCEDNPWRFVSVAFSAPAAVTRLFFTVDASIIRLAFRLLILKESLKIQPTTSGSV